VLKVLQEKVALFGSLLQTENGITIIVTASSIAALSPPFFQ
jgi:hypothetical protein